MFQFATNPAEALQEYKATGYHVEHNVWSASQMAALRDAARNFAGRSASDYRPLIQPHRQSELFHESLRNQTIVNVMKHLLGNKVSAIQSEYFFGAPGTHGFARHQDDYQVEAGPENFASAWSALTDVKQSNGALIIYPRSHKLGLVPTRKLPRIEITNQDPNAQNEECIMPPGFDPMTVELPAGSCVFIHSHLVHASHQNQSNGFRESVLFTYLVSNAKFRAGNFAKRAEIPILD